jgi:hypothetical protein
MKTLHIASGGHVVPSENAGSNPLALASEFHLGPAVQGFVLHFSPLLRVLDFDSLFVASNPLRRSISNTELSIVSGQCEGVARPGDLRIQVEGVCYAVPESFAKDLPVKNRGTLVWRAVSGFTTIDGDRVAFLLDPPFVGE